MQTTNQAKIADSLALKNLTSMSEERYQRTFNPVPNHFYQSEISNGHPIHDGLFDPFEPQQINFVREMLKKDPRRVWTLMDIGDQDVLVSGYQYARRVGFCRLGYVISATSVNEGVELYVPINKKLA